MWFQPKNQNPLIHSINPHSINQFPAAFPPKNRGIITPCVNPPPCRAVLRLRCWVPACCWWTSPRLCLGPWRVVPMQWRWRKTGLVRGQGGMMVKPHTETKNNHGFLEVFQTPGCCFFFINPYLKSWSNFQSRLFILIVFGPLRGPVVDGQFFNPRSSGCLDIRFSHVRFESHLRCASHMADPRSCTDDHKAAMTPQNPKIMVWAT